MPHTLQPLSLGKLLDETFDIYRRNILLFLGISAIPNIALLALQLGLREAALTNSSVRGWVAAFAGLIIALASLFVSSIVTAATTFAVSDIYLDTPTTVWTCFSRVASKALRVCYVSFVVSLIVTFGSLLCIAPGVYWAGLYGIAIPAVVLEKITGNASLRRSSSLTSDFVGRVIVVYFLTIIFTFGMTYALSAGVDALGSIAFHDTGIFTRQVFEEIASMLGGVLFGPVTAIGLTLVYYDLRVRKEAFDIERMMRLMAPENQASGASAS
jgi:hypothetical protein